MTIKTKQKTPRFVRLAPVLALIVVLLDQLIKWIAAGMPLGQKVALIPGLFWFSHIRNTGVSFGMLQGNNLLFIWITLIIFGILVYYYEKFSTAAARVAYWLIISGLVGNLIDRLLRGSVVDMFDFGWFPVFNIADSAICIAVAILVVEEIYVLAQKRKKKNKSKKQ